MRSDRPKREQIAFYRRRLVSPTARSAPCIAAVPATSRDVTGAHTARLTVHLRVAGTALARARPLRATRPAGVSQGAVPSAHFSRNARTNMRDKSRDAESEDCRRDANLPGRFQKVQVARSRAESERCANDRPKREPIAFYRRRLMSQNAGSAPCIAAVPATSRDVTGAHVGASCVHSASRRDGVRLRAPRASCSREPDRPERRDPRARAKAQCRALTSRVLLARTRANKSRDAESDDCQRDAILPGGFQRSMLRGRA